MTELQHFMLSTCFGATVGMLTGELITIIIFAVSAIKDKIRKHKERKASENKQAPCPRGRRSNLPPCWGKRKDR